MIKQKLSVFSNCCPQTEKILNLKRNCVFNLPTFEIRNGKQVTFKFRVSQIISLISVKNKQFQREFLLQFISQFKKVKSKVSNKRIVDVIVIENKILSSLNYGRTDENIMQITFKPIFIQIRHTKNHNNNRLKIFHHGFVTINKLFLLPISKCSCKYNNLFHFHDLQLHHP